MFFQRWHGTRPSEAAGLSWEEVDLAHGVAYIRRSFHYREVCEPKTHAAEGDRLVRSPLALRGLGREEREDHDAEREHERHVEQERGDEDGHDGLGLHGREDSIT